MDKLTEKLKVVFKFFIRGLLFIAPIGVTILLFLKIFYWFEELIDETKLEGFTLGIFIVLLFAVVSSIGYFGTTLISQPISEFIERVIGKIPVVNFVYSSVKDFMDAFVGNKKKFDAPVLVSLNDSKSVQKLGFITQSDLTNLGLPGKVVVYLPHSYAFSGNMYIVSKENVEPLELSSSELMKFIVSAGVAGFHELDEDEK